MIKSNDVITKCEKSQKVIDNLTKSDYYMHVITNGEQKEEKMDKKKMGSKLRELRGEKSQATVAKDLGVCQSTYAMYEMGERIPSDEKKKKIADYYNVTVQFLFFE